MLVQLSHLPFGTVGRAQSSQAVTTFLSMLTTITTAIASYIHDVGVPELTPADVRTLAVFGVFFLLVGLEARFAYREHAPVLVRQSYFTNLGSFILNDILMSLLAASSLLLVAERYADRGFLSGISNSFGKSLGSFLLLDLALYGWHRINHQVDALWVLHKVHHGDRCVNASTAFRLHGGEIVLTTLVKAVVIVLGGIDSAVLLANEAVITLFVMFHHTNITFRGERWLGRLIVVPYLHRAHHSVQRSEHDRNYGAVLSVWDRLFGTLTEQEPAHLGLQHVPGQSLMELVKFGLIWTLPQQPLALQAMISEAAYFRAERRGFAPGNELADWLEAEQEILVTAGALNKPRRSLDWTMLPALLLSRSQDKIRTTASSFHSDIGSCCSKLRHIAKAIVADDAKWFRWGFANASLRIGKRLPSPTMGRLCTQD